MEVSKLEKEDACEILSKKLEEMQVSRKLDESAIPTIGQAIQESKIRENYWLSNKEMPSQSAFVLYHATRNTRMILEKMHERFIHTAELHENPKVIDDAILVFPELQELCSFIDTMQKAEVTDSLLDFVRKRVRSLRNTAQKAQMFPSIDEEMKMVNKTDLKKELNAIADDFRLNLV